MYVFPGAVVGEPGNLTLFITQPDTETYTGRQTDRQTEGTKCARTHTCTGIYTHRYIHTHTDRDREIQIQTQTLTRTLTYNEEVTRAISRKVPWGYALLAESYYWQSHSSISPIRPPKMSVIVINYQLLFELPSDHQKVNCTKTLPTPCLESQRSPFVVVAVRQRLNSRRTKAVNVNNLVLLKVRRAPRGFK